MSGQPMPVRTATGSSNDAIPDDDTSETSKLFHERLSAWKHATAYLEDYVEATEKLHNSTSKDYEKVLKTVNSPLKEGHHFDQSLGGVAGLFDNVRTNTQGLQNSHHETAKTLKGSVLPIFHRLHTEIKNKTKELDKGVGKQSKTVDKARNASQKHIELLGQHAAASETSSHTIKASEDPYILQRQVYHRLNKQVLEENNSRDDIISVQNNFAQFESHVIQTIQQGITQLNQVLSSQAEQTRTMYGDVTANAQRVPVDFEWNSFVKRHANVLVDPSAGKRTIESIGFANQDHRSTRPLIAGSLERKSGLLKKYEAGFYAVTPSKYLHEFKTDDDFAKDPTPENSLYLPDCMIGAVDGVKFNVRGKDASGGAMSKLSRAHEFAFKAHTPEDALKWHGVIAAVAGQATNDLPSSTPASPIESRQTSATYPEATAASPVAATPVAGQQTGTVVPGQATTTESAAPLEKTS
ncbi:ph domain-containing protein [Zymoseptoria brevis]|uniref:Ph domain-containing protein n=1 Tax=Zymoseptoria brevis TaxID=1047168 RepID=A0A0F4GUG8_9PEZI|nr:ph domain-containing protein [Zymoseptoria brevis]